MDPAQDRPVVLDGLDAEPDRGPSRFAACRARPSPLRNLPGRCLLRAGQEQPDGDRGRQAAGRRGCGRYAVGPGPVWGEADRRSYAAWQRRLGYSGGSADGIPGRASWDRLRVPRM
ncbi:peptidoglycan-binding protein [Streptomyces sp. BE133]|uniref:peptidoglycan-binding protein n=1 Tax=Streptomyces sp. BE133 TaxID=3002523 RepID=UPI002E76DFB8|nr:peptidoglycan-binding protein [Streptomyces sp. BE133]MEE1808913.1 peptidoglycan-binding protein [Streptomyces sp. BE133]